MRQQQAEPHQGLSVSLSKLSLWTPQAQNASERCELPPSIQQAMIATYQRENQRKISDDISTCSQPHALGHWRDDR